MYAGPVSDDPSLTNYADAQEQRGVGRDGWQAPEEPCDFEAGKPAGDRGFRV